MLVHSQRPDGPARGEIILVHGLEGSSAAGYARSMSYAALEAGYATHRFNMRSCGGTEHLALSNYHSGQTSDLLYVLRERRKKTDLPIYLVGFSLGGNVVLKLTGELGEQAAGLVAAVCAVSTPIDLKACATALGKPENFIYEQRFLQRLRERIRLRHKQAPEIYSLEPLKKVRTIYDFDDLYTGPLFGFGNADNYYTTQSANRFIGKHSRPSAARPGQGRSADPFFGLRPPRVPRKPSFNAGRGGAWRSPRIHRPAPAAILARWPGDGLAQRATRRKPGISQPLQQQGHSMKGSLGCHVGQESIPFEDLLRQQR